MKISGDDDCRDVGDDDDDDDDDDRSGGGVWKQTTRKQERIFQKNEVPRI